MRCAMYADPKVEFGAFESVCLRARNKRYSALICVSTPSAWSSTTVPRISDEYCTHTHVADYIVRLDRAECADDLWVSYVPRTFRRRRRRRRRRIGSVASSQWENRSHEASSHYNMPGQRGVNEWRRRWWRCACPAFHRRVDSNVRRRKSQLLAGVRGHARARTRRRR